MAVLPSSGRSHSGCGDGASPCDACAAPRPPDFRENEDGAAVPDKPGPVPADRLVPGRSLRAAADRLVPGRSLRAAADQRSVESVRAREDAAAPASTSEAAWPAGIGTAAGRVALVAATRRTPRIPNASST